MHGMDCAGGPMQCSVSRRLACRTSQRFRRRCGKRGRNASALTVPGRDPRRYWMKRWCGLPRNTVRRDGAVIRPPRQGLAWRRIQRLESLNRVNTASLATTHWTSRSPAADSKRPLQPQRSFGKPCKRSVDFFGCGSLGHYRQPALAGQEPATGWHAGMRRLGAGEQGRAGQRTACPARYINARTGRSESRWAAAHRAEAAKWIALDSPIRQ